MLYVRNISAVLIAFAYFCLPLSACPVELSNKTSSVEIKRAKTIIVKNDVDLRGRIIEFRKNAKLSFEGGSISNGQLVFNKTLITGDDIRLHGKVSGTVKNDTIYIDWFIQGTDLDGMYSSGVLGLTGMKEIHLNHKEYELSVNSLMRGIRLTDVVFDGEDCLIKAKPGGRLDYPLLPFTSCRKVTIKNIRLLGSNEEGTNAGARHNLSLAGCENVTITDVTSQNAYTDGLYIIGSIDIEVERFKAYSSGRQGSSIISGKNITISGCTFDGSHRFAPKAGLDIEPNTALDELDAIKIENCSFVNNTSSGLTILLKTRNNNKPCSIAVSCYSFERKGSHISVSSAPNSGKGTIDIGTCQMKNSRGVAFQSKCYSSEGTPVVEFHDSSIENVNTDCGQDVREQASFISVHNLSSGSVDTDFGNISIYNIEVRQDKRNLKALRRIINLYPDPKQNISNVSISDIKTDIDLKEDNHFSYIFKPTSGVKNVSKNNIEIIKN